MAMKTLLVLMLAGLSLPAMGAELSSAYTRLDQDKDCEVVDKAEEGDGEWADLVCPGYEGTSYMIRYGDGRETITYGDAEESGMPSFAPFNYSNGTVEWRLNAGRPVAAIQRWYLANEEGQWQTQILVVSKVGQAADRQACVIGYVAANEGGTANERARLISNEAEAFACGTDRPVVEAAIAQFVPPAE